MFNASDFKGRLLVFFECQVLLSFEKLNDYEFVINQVDIGAVQKR
jgi:hypothetical protein